MFTRRRVYHRLFTVGCQLLTPPGLHCGAPSWIHWRMTSIVDCGRYGPPEGIRKPTRLGSFELVDEEAAAGISGNHAHERRILGTRDADQVSRAESRVEPQSLLRARAAVAAGHGAVDREDVGLDGGERRREARYGRREIAAASESGCPFSSSPSPLPAPQAARTSVTIAIAAAHANLSMRLLDRDIPANLPGRRSQRRERSRLLVL